MNLELVYSN